MSEMRRQADPFVTCHGCRLNLPQIGVSCVRCAIRRARGEYGRFRLEPGRRYHTGFGAVIAQALNGEPTPRPKSKGSSFLPLLDPDYWCT